MGYAIVPRLWPGSTIICLGSGPSLTAEDVALTRGYHVLAINDTYRLAPHLSVLYAADLRWWDWHPDALRLPCLRFGTHTLIERRYPEVGQLRHVQGAVWCTDPSALAGSHGGLQAINLAWHLGAGRIVLLGYDMQPAPDGRNHFFGEHPDGTHVNYVRRLKDYEEVADRLARMGIEIVNCSRVTAIPSIPRMRLTEALTAAAPAELQVH